MTDPLTFVVTLVLRTAALILVFRFVLQAVRASFYNPFSEGVVRITDPLLNPLRRLLPPYRNLDFASFALAWVAHMIATGIVAFSIGAPLNLFHILNDGLHATLSLVVWVFLVAIFLSIVMSWLAPNVYSPAAKHRPRGRRTAACAGAAHPAADGRTGPVADDHGGGTLHHRFLHPDRPAADSRVGRLSSAAHPGADSVGIVTPRRAHFDEHLTLQCGETLAGFDLVLRDLRNAERRPFQRGADLPRALRQPPRGGLPHRAGCQTRLVGRLHRPPASPSTRTGSSSSRRTISAAAMAAPGRAWRTRRPGNPGVRRSPP